MGKITIKLALNLFLTLFALLTFTDKSLSLTNYQIKKICRKERRESTCIKNLRQKKLNLEKGVPIEIPVIPFNRW